MWKTLGYVTRVQGRLPFSRSPMGSFGEDLRMERLSRGIALEEITAVTKISQRHLLALGPWAWTSMTGRSAISRPIRLPVR